MAAAREMVSVGIDVGTTTTQVVFSRLSVRNSNRLGMVPRLEVDARSVLYHGEIHLTPLRSPREVDVEALLKLIHADYDRAGIEAAGVETGAVIVTGETARTRNAEAILAAVADLAGDFVVTVAGPNVEAQIAGRGSGAAAYSAEHYTTVTSVDIGGGSANAAVFRSGRHLASSAIMVGGRQLTLDPASGTVTGLAPSGRAIVGELGLDLAEGRRAGMRALRDLTESMAELIVDLMLGQQTSLGARLALSPPLPAEVAHSAQVVFLTGGVGRAYYDQDPAGSVAEVAAFGDVGPLLATSLRDNARLRDLTVLRPAATLRATVLGAASQTVTLSGSTIWAEPELLPLRNLPVVEPDVGGVVPGADDLAQAVRSAAARWDRPGAVALALELPRRMDYPTVQRIAQGIAAYVDAEGGHRDQPVVLVTDGDYAKVLGQTISGMMPQLPLISIDQIALGEGDFIDIGTPILDGRVVPVSVKTLVFYE